MTTNDIATMNTNEILDHLATRLPAFIISYLNAESGSEPPTISTQTYGHPATVIGLAELSKLNAIERLKSMD